MSDGITLTVMSLILGLGLAVAADFFHVEPDLRVEAIEGMLPGINCGTCGFPGCHAFAEGIVDREVERLSQCKPGKDKHYDPIIAYLKAHPNPDRSVLRFQYNREVNTFMGYKYTKENLITDPINYSFSDVSDPYLIEDYFRSRQKHLNIYVKKLALKPQDIQGFLINESEKAISKNNPICENKLLLLFEKIKNKDFEKIIYVQKFFEVHKKIHFMSKHLKFDRLSSFSEIENYIISSFLFSYTILNTNERLLKLTFLNSLIKINDTIISTAKIDKLHDFHKNIFYLSVYVEVLCVKDYQL